MVKVLRDKHRVEELNPREHHHWTRVRERKRKPRKETKKETEKISMGERVSQKPRKYHFRKGVPDTVKH